MNSTDRTRLQKDDYNRRRRIARRKRAFADSADGCEFGTMPGIREMRAGVARFWAKRGLIGMGYHLPERFNWRAS